MAESQKQDIRQDLYSISNSIRVYKLPMIVCSVGLVVCVLIFLLMVQNNMGYQKRNFLLVSSLEGKLVRARFTEIFTAIDDAAQKTSQSFTPGRINTATTTIAQMPEVKAAYLLSLNKKVAIHRTLYQQPANPEAENVIKEIITSPFLGGVFSQYVYLPTGASLRIFNYRTSDKTNKHNYLIATLGFAKFGKPWALVYFIDIDEMIKNIIKAERKNTDFSSNLFLTRNFEGAGFGLIYEYYDNKRLEKIDIEDKFSILRRIGNETFNNQTDFEYNQQKFAVLHVPTNDYLSSVVNLNIWLTLLSLITIICMVSFFLLYLITRNVRIQDLVDMRTSELMDATRNLADKNQDLIEINKELEDFTYIISHDIRSPLINLKGFSDEIQMAAERIKQEVSTPDVPKEKSDKITGTIEREIEESISYLQRAVKSLDSMTSSILDFSRLGKIQLKIEEINITKLLEEILARYSHQIKSKNITIKIGKMPHVMSDYISLREVFSNILDNAIKYLPNDREGLIEISGKFMPDMKYTMFSIRDNGAGISSEAKKKVFQIFRRATLDKSIPGHGMGMPFVRAILKKLRGRIWFKSIAGKGTTFYFVIPSANEQ